MRPWLFALLLLSGCGVFKSYEQACLDRGVPPGTAALDQCVHDEHMAATLSGMNTWTTYQMIAK